MKDAPELDDLYDDINQKMVVDAALEAIEDCAPSFWAKGRGAGKSTVRALIARAILDAEDHPLYEVRPKHYA